MEHRACGRDGEMKKLGDNRHSTDLQHSVATVFARILAAYTWSRKSRSSAHISILQPDKEAQGPLSTC